MFALKIGDALEGVLKDIHRQLRFKVLRTSLLFIRQRVD